MILRLVFDRSFPIRMFCGFEQIKKLHDHRLKSPLQLLFVDLPLFMITNLVVCLSDADICFFISPILKNISLIHLLSSFSQNHTDYYLD